ncbi:MAG: transglutaminase-like domain-containing protein [Suipraeoptans sp.]
MNRVLKHIFIFLISIATFLSLTVDFGVTTSLSTLNSFSFVQDISAYFDHIGAMFAHYFNTRIVIVDNVAVSPIILALLYIFILIWIGIFYYHFKNLFMACLPCLISFAGLFVIGHVPKFYILSLFFIGLVGNLSSPYYKRALVSLISCFIIFVIIVQFFPVPPKSDLASLHHNVNTYVADNTPLEMGRYGLYLPSNADSIGNGDLNDAGNRSYSGTVKAVVTLDSKPTAKVFLKGCTSDTYSNNTWSSGGNGLFESMIEKNSSNTNLAKQEIANYAYYRLNSFERSRITIEIKDSIGKYQLIPYAAYVPTSFNIIDDSYIEKKRDTESFYFIRSIYVQSKYKTVMSYDRDNLLDSYNVFDQKNTTENWYTDYVRDASLDTTPLSHEFIESFSGKFNSSSSKVNLMLIKNSLATYASYNLSPGKTPKDSDFIDYFLFKNHEGYCVHFASAGVMMLRLNGIPARYAVGYAILPNAFIEQEDGTYKAEVKDNNAHAWVEIYTNDLGWIPFEMTPPSNSVSTFDNNTSNSSDDTNNSDNNTSTTESESNKDAKSDETTTTENERSVVEPSRISWEIIIIAVLLIILCIVLTFLYKWYYFKKHYIAPLSSDSYKVKIEAMFGLFQKLTLYSGINVEHDEFLAIANKAAYSDDKVNENDYKNAQILFNKLFYKIYDLSPRNKQLALRIIKKQAGI